MSTFYFLAVNKAAKKMLGSLQAEDERALRKTLNSFGLSVLSVSATTPFDREPGQTPFDFTAKNKREIEYSGTIDAANIIAAYDSLALEWELTPAWIIESDASPEAKAEAKTLGVQPILDAKRAQEEAETARKNATFAGQLGQLVKKVESAGKTEAAPAEASKLSLSPTPAPQPAPAPAAEPVPAAAPKRLSLGLASAAAQPVAAPAPAPAAPPPASQAEPAPAPVLEIALPAAESEPAPAEAASPAPAARPSLSADSILAKLNFGVPKVEANSLLAKLNLEKYKTQFESHLGFIQSAEFRELARSAGLEFAHAALLGTAGLLTAAAIFFAITAGYDWGALSSFARAVIVHSTLLPFAAVSAWILFGALLASQKIHERIAVRVGALWGLTAAFLVVLGVNVVY